MTAMSGEEGADLGHCWKPGRPKLVERVLDVQKDQLCYIVGTIYMDMPLKPNVLEDISKDVSSASYSPPCAGAPPPPSPVSLASRSS
jgi:hypothetical protein